MITEGERGGLEGFMLKTRVITAAILIPALLVIIFFLPKIVFAGLIFTVSVVGLYEYYSIILKKSRLDEFLRWFGVVFTSCFSFFLLFLSQKTSLLIGILLILSVFMVLLFSRLEFDAIFAYLGKVALGVFYPALVTCYLVFIHRMANGPDWLIFLLGVVWFCDSGAYFVGKGIGKNKLYSRVSPGKTVEGLIGGVITGTLGGLLFNFLFALTLKTSEVIILSILLSILGQIGDLCESAIKRYGGVKDSGKIIPGHGGILDRVDAIIFTAPFLYLYAHYVK